jgi:hypothetical protein
VCLNEVKYFYNKKTGKLFINLKNDYSDAGKIELLSATEEQITKLSTDLTKKHIYGNQVLDRIDPGELTLLAILNAQPDKYFICTGDGAAIVAATVLGFAAQCISLEKLLHDIGITKPMKYACTEKHLEDKIADGISCIVINDISN